MSDSIETTMVDSTRDWQRNRTMWVRILEKRTGVGVDAWKRRIMREGLDDEASLRAWLTSQGVTGYGQSLLVMERFGYPDFLLATADELIDAQYEDRPGLRPIFDAIIAAAMRLGKVTVQARKTYVSLVSPRRTFARIQATTKGRVDLGLRIEGVAPDGRLQPSRIHETMPLQIGLSTLPDIDDEVVRWLRRAYDENS
ncbi:MAG: hypothetical protein K0S86_196 [Geminicoccaceae bacterium]|jgi:hypothetical protein|nr:hypothetical protein [Geminicoccaceae bacterium]